MTFVGHHPDGGRRAGQSHEECMPALDMLERYEGEKK
jgi:hypothetical protein